MIDLTTNNNIEIAKSLLQDYDSRMYIERDSFFDNNFQLVQNESEVEQLRTAVQKAEMASQFIENFGLDVVCEFLTNADSQSNCFIWTHQTEFKGVVLNKKRHICLKELKRQIAFLSKQTTQEHTSGFNAGARVYVNFNHQLEKDSPEIHFHGHGILDRVEDGRVFGRLDDGRTFTCMFSDVVVLGADQ